MAEHPPDSPRFLGPTVRRSHASAAAELQPVLVNLREPLALLRRHLWLVLGITAAVTAFVGYRAYDAVPAYRAVAVIRLSDPRRALTGGVAENPGGGLDGGWTDPVLSQVGLLTSRAVADVVVDSMPILRVRTKNLPRGFLRDFQLAPEVTTDSLRFEFGADSLTIRGGSREIRTTYGARVDVGGIAFTPVARPAAPRGTAWITSREAAINRVVGGLRVTPRQRTDILDVAYVANDPQDAQQVVNHVVVVFRAVSAEQAQRESRLRRVFLETQLKVNDSLLADARRALTAFRQHAGRAGPGPQTATQQAGIDQLQFQREQFEADRRMYRSILASLDTAGGRGNREALRAAASAPGIAASAVVAQLFTQLAQYETARDSLAARSVVHPDLARVNLLIATTEGKLLRAVQGAVQGLIASLAVRIAALDELRARRAASVAQLSATDAEADRLEERVENARKIADELRSEFQKARIAEAVEVGRVEIVDLAVLSSAPLGIGLSQKLALGLLLGLVLGGGSAFLTEHMRSSVGRPKEIEDLGLPVLGAVPRCKDGRNGSRAKEIGPAIEAFRGLRLSVVHAYGAAGPVVFAISSAASRDGKSFVASNLALAFAQANYRTLLIDGDTRRGTLHRVLSAARKPGLIDFLSGEVSLADILQATRYRSLHFIGCGIRRPDSPELLHSTRMSDLVANVRTHFGVIIVDTPPFGAGVDAFSLATVMGHLVMVLRSGTTNRELVQGKLDLLHRLPVRVLGAVLNDVRPGPGYEAYSYYLQGYEATEEAVRKHQTLLRADS